MKPKSLSILSACFVAASTVLAQDQFTNGLVAYYPFNGNANDASGNGNDASPAGNYFYTNGLSGNGLRIIGDFSQFYSGGGYVMLPTFGSNMNSGYSISLWVKDEVIGEEPVGAEAYINFQASVGYPHCQIFMLNWTPSPRPSVAYEINDTVTAANFEQSIGTYPVNAGNYPNSWKHLALVSEPGRFACYFNGSKVYQTNIFLNSIFPAQFAALGRHQWQPGSSSARMSVTYDNVRIYQRALSDSDVTSLYNYEKSPVIVSNSIVPRSIMGDGVLSTITDGTYPFVSSGYALFLPANSGNTYQIIGIYNTTGSRGTYSYTVTGDSSSVLNLNDSLAGLGNISADFADSNSGSYRTTANSYPGAYQSGYFNFASANAPASMVGKTFVGAVYDGGYPFAYSGLFTFHAAASGNTYTIIGDGVSTVNSSGTYSYSLVNRSTGKLVVNDVQIGTATAYLGLTDSSDGGYAITQPSTGGFQIGTFVVLDTTRPQNVIMYPTPQRKIQLAPTDAVITATGKAKDNVSVASVWYQLNGAGWNIASTANNWTNWSANNLPLNPGTNLLQAFAVDTSGNFSLTNKVIFSRVPDRARPINLITPQGRITNAVITVTGKAKDNVGVASVWYQLNGGGWNMASTGNNWTNWSANNLAFIPGVNLFRAFAVDTSGNFSITNRMNFTRTVVNP